MRKSVLSKYFALCSAIILASVACIGSMLLLVTTQFYKTEKKQALLAGTEEIVSATKLCFLTRYTLDTSYLNSLYKNSAVSSGVEYTLTDRNGNTLVCSEPPPCRHLEGPMDSVVMAEVTRSRGAYFSVGNLNGYYDRSYYTLALPVTVGQSTYYVFATSSASALNLYLRNLLEAFFVALTAAMLVAFWAVYLSTRQLVKPFQEMTEAAERFGRGDFSQKVEVSEGGEIGRLADSLNEMAYSLANLENTRKAFVANVSHELKTPMTTIGGFVDGILDGTIPRAKERHYLTVVSQEVSRLGRLVRSMLNITKYETGEVEMKRVSVEITALTVQTLLLFEDRIEQKRLDIQGLDSPPLYVKADIDLTQQILYNLIENAVKFVNNGGVLSFSFEMRDGWIYTAVRNTGEGLTADEMPKVFDRFYKTDESHGKDKTGVGLGLAIVRSIINLHGGEISVRSVKDEYTEFTFSLPASSKAEFQEEQRKKKEDAPPV